MKNVTKLFLVLLVFAAAFGMSPQARSQTTLLTESFENGGAIPPNWATVIVAGSTNGISYVTSQSTGYPSITVTPYNGSYEVFYNSYSIVSGSTRLYRTAGTSTVGYAGASIDFAMFHDLGYGGTSGEGITPQYSIDGGANWTAAGSIILRNDGSQGWKIHTITLPANAGGQANLRIAFLFSSQFGNNCFMDFAHLYGFNTGTLAGTVTNTFGGAPVVGASVVVNALPAVVTNGVGFYTVPNVNAGNATINATAAGFTPYVGSATVVAGTTTTKNFQMTPIPSYLTGIITNASTGAPIHGAWIQVGTTSTYSLPNGSYYFQAYPPGLQTVTVSKPGFITSAATTTITTGGTTTYSVALQVTAYAPGTVTAALNATSTAVDISWLAPTGMYEMIYDDGGRENWTVWAAEGNMNAVKFTPITGGVQVNAGKINIGDAANYAAGTDPTLLAPFQIAVYDATGPAGAPGAQIGSPIDVTPANFGWNIFTFPTPISVTGTFYLVMIQGGIPPNAAHLGVDETTNNLRSYSRFVTGSGPWLPASGNYMIRAVVTGLGGPLDIDATASKTEITANPIEGLIYDHTPASVTGVEGDGDYVPTVIPYTVWRLLEGQEANEPLWGAPIASNITGMSTVDNSWPSLPDGPYRWAVKAGYPVNRFSPPTFSNVIGKNWTAAVTVNVSLTCAVTPVAGTLVKLQNTAFSQYVYTATTPATGIVTFPAVWKGTYDLIVSKIGYDTYTLPAQVIMGPMTFDVVLLQQKLAPSNMFVNNKSLVAIWNAPMGLSYPLNEDFASGSFATNGWTAEAYWTVYTGFGNPAPSAYFPWSPTLTNYSRSLTSKVLTGTGSPDQKLLYDINLNDFAGDGNEHLAVEMQIGAGAWTLLKDYANNGAIPWTTETLNIVSVGSQTFKVRFRVYGANSYNINYWYVDNIKVRSIAPDPKPCILAYNIYLNGVLDGVTANGTDTTYQIPPSHVTYNTVYTACVKAVYGSGYSGQSCYTFTSKFLYPPTNLEVEAVECAAYLTWEKPVAYKKTNVPAFKGTLENSVVSTSAGLAPIDRSQMIAPEAQQTTGSRGSIAFGFEGIACDWIDFDLDNLSGLTILAAGPYGTSDFVNGLVYQKGSGNLAWACTYYSTHLYTIDHTTLAWTDVGNMGTAMHELTMDNATGIIYGTNLTSLYTIDPTVPSATMIGSHGTTTYMIAIACDANGDMWGDDIVNNRFYSINKTTGAATIIGNLGFTCSYAQSMFYDPATDQVILGAMNGGNLTAEIRAVDVTTGASTILSSYYYNEVTAANLPQGPPPIQGLIGYKIYRDGPQVHYIGDPDTLFWYDLTVEPGVHTYQVSAWYDLTGYGFPGQFDESMLEGPTEIDIMCGRELPFYEPWTQGSLTYQDWTLDPLTNNNWSVSSTTGNPVPSADFSWVPIQYNYELSLETPVLNGGPFTCAMIWCDFDYKLIDRNSTGAEKLYVDVFFKGAWKNKAEFSNTASKDWTPMHVDISAAKGKAFKVRFRAAGENSSDILHWLVDNIHIYAKCNPPIELDVTDVNDLDVTLTWNKPACGADGPDPIWIYWDDGTNADAIGTGGAANFDCAARWDASQIANLDGGAVTKISFYPASTGTGSFKVRVWQGPDAATLLVDQAVPTVTWDDFNIVDIASPVPIDITQELWIGYNIDATGGWPAGVDPGPAVVGYGDMIYFGGVWASMYTAYGLDYNWNIRGYVEAADDHALLNKGIVPLVQNNTYKSSGTLSASGLPSLNTEKFNPEGDAATEVRALLGYNVYRSDDGKVTYNKRNTNLITDTSYVDAVPSHDDFYYYVTSVFPTYGSLTCESDSSNVVAALLTGIDPMNSGGKISIYPNPATDNVFVKSDFTITNIEVLNFIGQTVYTRNNVSEKTSKVNVANFTAGVYFVKVTTTEGIKTVKITVTK